MSISYGFIKTENLNHIDFLDVKEKAMFNSDRSMFFITWIGDTPSALFDILESVLDEHEVINVLKQEEWSGDWNIYG